MQMAAGRETTLDIAIERMQGPLKAWSLNSTFDRRGRPIIRGLSVSPQLRGCTVEEYLASKWQRN